MDDKLNNFACKVSSLSLRVEKMEDRINKLENSHRSPSPKTRSLNPQTCYGCGNTGHFISQCPERRVKSVRFEDQKKRKKERVRDRCPDAWNKGQNQKTRSDGGKKNVRQEELAGIAEVVLLVIQRIVSHRRS
ncbi:hypothetical protein PoB_000032200 [Plakobranchus ocellatus]|uniref:CCHC-type domain-containing protein n=1 Tax=Plakobranchus ocellatus TaxID=259542 RepID=A0AAV3XT22_9GAST|nr:hypothetical protein PoB_000032200 [Plakobranchus ocellatus]